MPFGLTNAPASFNRMMRMILAGLSQTDSFLDDILIHTVSFDDHLSELRSVFQRLREANLTAKPSKCFVAFNRLEYLGHSIGEGILTPNEGKLQAIRGAPRPETKKQVRSFLGLIGFYRKFEGLCELLICVRRVSVLFPVWNVAVCGMCWVLHVRREGECFCMFIALVL